MLPLLQNWQIKSLLRNRLEEYPLDNSANQAPYRVQTHPDAQAIGRYAYKIGYAQRESGLRFS